mgnify:CR=1 FL=1
MTGMTNRHMPIFSTTCGEELGLVGCLAIIVLEFLLVYRCFQTARLAKSSMDALICVGFGTMLIFQVVENIGMCLFVMPVIGLTLPFFRSIQYWGSLSNSTRPPMPSPSTPKPRANQYHASPAATAIPT